MSRERAEIITGSNEGKASEMPAETVAGGPAVPRVRTSEGHLHDLIDLVQNISAPERGSAQLDPDSKLNLVPLPLCE